MHNSVPQLVHQGVHHAVRGTRHNSDVVCIPCAEYLSKRATSLWPGAEDHALARQELIDDSLCRLDQGGVPCVARHCRGGVHTRRQVLGCVVPELPIGHLYDMLLPLRLHSEHVGAHL